MSGQDEADRQKLPHGQQPEALATFGAAARHGGVKPDDVKLDATAETAPTDTDPQVKDEAATQTLRAGVEHRTEDVADIVDRVPDRTGASRD